MNKAEFMHRIVQKYMGEPMDSFTAKHIEEDVKSVYDGVDTVTVKFNYLPPPALRDSNRDPFQLYSDSNIDISITFKSEAYQTWFIMQWT